MVRDYKMGKLVGKEKEANIPFVEKIKSLLEYNKENDEDGGISSILVNGSSGEYFEVADTVLKLS